MLIPIRISQISFSMHFHFLSKTVMGDYVLSKFWHINSHKNFSKFNFERIFTVSGKQWWGHVLTNWHVNCHMIFQKSRSNWISKIVMNNPVTANVLLYILTLPSMNPIRLLKQQKQTQYIPPSLRNSHCTFPNKIIMSYIYTRTRQSPLLLMMQILRKCKKHCT